MNSYRHRVYLFIGILPYAAIGIGMYLFSSGWLAILSYHVGMIAALLLSKQSLALSMPGKRAMAQAAFPVALFLAGGMAIFFIWPFTGGALNAPLQQLGLSSFWPFAVYFCLLNPVLEELFWRGLVASNIKWTATGDILFGGYHALVLYFFVPWQFCLAAAIILTGTGAFLRKTVETSGGLFVATCAHFASDVGVVACVYLIRSNSL